VRPVAATLALVLIAAALPQFAAAQDDGVFFDPGGPSEKEYAMPHDQARGGGGHTPSSGQGGGGSPSSGQTGGSGTASPNSGSGTQGGSVQSAQPSAGSSDAPLFGAGVTRAQRDRKGSQKDSVNGGAETGQAASGGGDNVVGLAPASADTDTATGLGWFLAIAAVVALLGGGLACITRSRTRDSAT
jgi:hypothetical protein